MSKFYWGTAFAIGLVAGVTISMFFLVWAVPEFRAPNVAFEYSKNWQATSKAGPGFQHDNSHFWVREFYGWIFAEDSLAQWLMAVFGATATIISVVALVWLKRTWDQTRRGADAAWAAIDETRRIGRAQVRAYLSGEGGRFKVEPAVVRVEIDVRNAGQSPASEIKVRGSAYAYIPKNTGGAFTLDPMPKRCSVDEQNGPIISAGGLKPVFLLFPSEGFGLEEIDVSDQIRFVSAKCTITWRDVFRGQGEITISLWRDERRADTLVATNYSDQAEGEY